MTDTAKLMEEAALARREDRLDEAHRGYTEAAAIYRANEDRPSLIRALKGVGQIDCDQGNLEAALLAYEEAAALARAQSDPFLLAHTIRHVGDVLCRLGRPTEAEACYTEALALYRNEPNAPRLDLANAIRAMAALKDSLGAAREALPLWEEAHEIYASLGVQAGVAESKARQARIARQNQQ